MVKGATSTHEGTKRQTGRSASSVAATLRDRQLQSAVESEPARRSRGRPAKVEGYKAPPIQWVDLSNYGLSAQIIEVSRKIGDGPGAPTQSRYILINAFDANDKLAVQNGKVLEDFGFISLKTHGKSAWIKKGHSFKHRELKAITERFPDMKVETIDRDKVVVRTSIKIKAEDQVTH